MTHAAINPETALTDLEALQGIARNDAKRINALEAQLADTEAQIKSLRSYRGDDRIPLLNALSDQAKQQKIDIETARLAFARSNAAAFILGERFLEGRSPATTADWNDLDSEADRLVGERQAARALAAESAAWEALKGEHYSSL